MERVYTVTDFNRSIKSYLEENPQLKDFFIEGELSGVTYYKSGHLYFNLKDDKSQIKCAAFKYKYKRIPEDLKEGDFVKIFGDASFYEVRGDFHISVRHLEKQSKVGQLFAELEKVKEQMRKAGYFDENKKKLLPRYPKNIGVVTAITGAAVQDIIKTIKKRDDRINIYVYPAKVQGNGASKEIIKGIEVLNKIPEIDLIIAGRGGGSIEDLWAFNEKETAMAFFNSQKPIISAVGHEIDFLLTDLTADARAATPTQAVELSVPEKIKNIEFLKDKKKYLSALLIKQLEKKKKKLSLRKEHYMIKNFNKIIENKNQLLIEKEKKLGSLMSLNFIKFKNEFNLKLEKTIALNPLKVLERGYSVVTSDTKVIKSIEDVEIDKKLDIRVMNGVIKAKVEEIITEKIEE